MLAHTVDYMALIAESKKDTMDTKKTLAVGEQTQEYLSTHRTARPDDLSL